MLVNYPGFHTHAQIITWAETCPAKLTSFQSHLESLKKTKQIIFEHSYCEMFTYFWSFKLVPTLPCPVHHSL